MRELAASVAGLAGGIFVRSVFILAWPVAAFALILFLLCGGAALGTSRRLYGLLAILFLFFSCGFVRTVFAEPPPSRVFTSELRRRVAYEGVVSADPDIRDTSERIAVRVTEQGRTTQVLAVIPRTTAPVRLGDRVRVTGTLLAPVPFASDGGRVFRYDKYLEASGIRFLLEYGSLTVQRHAPWYSVYADLARVKQWFENGLTRALPEPYASLASGIVIGGKSGLGSDLQNAFVQSGLVHVIVLSGYNIMVVAEWVMALVGVITARYRLPRALGALAAGLVLIGFVLMAGVSASALRASVMALLALYALATGRTYTASRALFAAVFLMLVYHPLYLVFDPGFGLSVAATAGLLWLTPPLERRLFFIPSALWREGLATALAAQVAVLPLILYWMGNLSIYSVPANLLIMPFMPLAMAASAGAGIGGALMPLLGVLFGVPAYMLTWYFIAVAQTTVTLPYAGVIVPAFSFTFVLVAYAALFSVASLKRFSTTSQFVLERNASI